MRIEKVKRTILAAAAVAAASASMQANAVTMRPVLEDADVQKIAVAAEAAIAQHHTSGCVAIADADGEVLLVQRNQDAAPSCVSSALGKVKTAARFQTKSEVFYKALTQDKSLMMLTIPEMTALPGGVPLVSAGKVVGPVAISTPDPSVDLEIVQAAAAALK